MNLQCSQRQKAITMDQMQPTVDDSFSLEQKPCQERRIQNILVNLWSAKHQLMGNTTPSHLYPCYGRNS